jgi:nucleoside-diphosphate-sugar epimerase
MKRILITGASGYIGKAFIYAYGSRYNLRLLGRTQVKGNDEFIQGDIRNLADVDRASRNIDSIIHLAAVTTDRTNITDLDYFENNTVGTFNVLEAAAKNKVAKVVYGSSVCAVGFRATPKLVMETDHCEPSDGMYGYSKYLSERLCEYYAKKHEVRIICLRTSMVIPQHDLVLPRNPFASRWMGVVHIEDVVEAYRLAVENEDILFDVFHIAAENSCSKFDITRAKNILGYRPKHNFMEHTHEGLLRTTVGRLQKIKDKFTSLIKRIHL